MPRLAAEAGPLNMDLGLQDARAIVTGASKGIGLAVTGSDFLIDGGLLQTVR